MDWIEEAAAELFSGEENRKRAAYVIRRHYEASHVCGICGGCKTETIEYDNPEGIDDSIVRPCRNCNGTGKVVPIG